MSNLINLKKNAKISLEKKGINTETEKVNVVLALDLSGSMSRMYADGLVQQVVERILAIGLNMDKDKQIDVYLFGAGHYHVGNAHERNYSNYVKDEILSKHSLEGSTNYAGVMKMISEAFVGEVDGFSEDSSNLNSTSNSSSSVKPKGLFGKLFGKKVVEEVVDSVNEIVNIDTTKKDATIVFFITDGDNFDQAETETFIKAVSKHSIFWQFVGIGTTNFKFLKKLDGGLGGRVIDNANFFQLNDISKISDSELYDRILDEFPSWLKESRNKGITN